MALFTRRILQRLIFENAALLTTEQRQRHADAINRGGRESLAFEWEIAVLNALHRVFRVEHESATGEVRPDVVAMDRPTGQKTFVADIATIFEAGRNEANPSWAFQRAVVARADKIGLKRHSLGFKIGGTKEGGKGKEVMRLRLPPIKDIPNFVASRVDPFLRECKSAPDETRELKIADNAIDVEIRYAPGGDSLTSSHPDYTASYSLTRNPLFNTIKRKLDQLKRTGIEAPQGVIACAADFDLRPSSGSTFDSSRIIAEAFRQNAHLSFVLTLWSEDSFDDCPIRARLYRNSRALHALSDDAALALQTIATNFPAAANTGMNALYELDFWRWRRGRYFYGSWGMSKQEIKVSARLLMELLAGRLTLEEFLARNGGDQGYVPFFEQRLRKGQILSEVRIEREPEKDDDWVVFHFSEWDPALGPLRAQEN